MGARSTLASGRPLAKYRVESVIGKGRHGPRLRRRGHHPGQQRRHQFLPDSLTEIPRPSERFITEAQVAGRLNHPTSSPSTTLGREGDHYYMVMELLNPTSAASYVKERGP